MESCKDQKSNKNIPVENHGSAAWADSAGKKDLSCVNLPGLDQVKEAKEYVDENEK